MSKKMLCLMMAVLMLGSCSKEEPIEKPVEVTPPPVVREEQTQTKEQNVEIKEETTSSNWPYSPVDMSKPMSDDPNVIKYLDYFFGPAQHVVFLEMDGEQISDKSVAVYSFLEAWMSDPTSELSDGFPQEQLNELSMKYFGRVPDTYESSMLTVNPDTGNVQSTGWGGSAYYHVLREREELPDGKLRLVFDLIEPYSSSYDLPISYEEFKHAVYSGQLDCVWPSFQKKELILSEHTDENGQFYVQYHSVSVVE